MINDRRPMIDEVVNEGVDEMSMSVSRGNDTEIDLQGQDECHQQGQRAKHKHQNPKEETLYKKISNSRSTAPGGCYVSSSSSSSGLRELPSPAWLSRSYAREKV